MNGFVVSLVITALLALATSVSAVPPGKSLEWENSQGVVKLEGDTHALKGLKCAECHAKIFKMKQGSAQMKMAEINEGKYCGECHNGNKAFKTNDQANCSRCHI